MQEEDACISDCKKEVIDDQMAEINFNINPEKFLILKASSTTSNSFLGKLIGNTGSIYIQL